MINFLKNFFNWSGRGYVPNLSPEYLIHDGSDYLFNEEKLEEFRTQDRTHEDNIAILHKLNHFINDVNILEFVIGRADEGFSNTICDFTFNDKETMDVFFGNMKITYYSENGDIEFISKNLEQLFMPYLLCIHGALAELYIELASEREKRIEEQRRRIFEYFEDHLQDLTHKQKKD